MPGAPDDPLAALRARTACADAGAQDWLALGRALLSTPGDRWQAALDALLAAYRLDPALDSPHLLTAIAQLGFKLRAWPLVDDATSRLLADDPRDGNALVWRAASCEARGDLDAAERLLREAAANVPDNTVVMHKLALCVKEQARFDEAHAWFARARALDGANPYLRFDHAELALRAGDFARGWCDYEARLALPGEAPPARAALAAVSAYWRGEPLAGRTLVVFAEQGHGDCLWAARFLPRLAERVRGEGGRLIVGYDGPLRGLLSRALPVEVVLETAMLTRPDFHCGLMSLPLRLGIDDPSAWGRPYLRAEAGAVAGWRAWVDARAAGRRRVGIVWNGDPRHVRDARRSIPAEQFATLLTVPGIAYFALSPGRGDTLAAWRAHGIAIEDPMQGFAADFDAVAALAMNLDLVVTVDSGPAHLAGALGVPTCLMIDRVSAWFWQDAREAAPWYDAIRLYRQERVGAWAPVLAQVRERLVNLTGG
ncbi:ADP-heptose--LPS heptosyltransferase [Burkholderia sp. FERM BP-3421]|jgi:tetratricopeptide (TPR) repeat protein|uniref:tetratricopeptide repeat protein n=1 Tax=Burkholderia sp. FERM BP-3421 TaxID=1494466 RepID=UPI00235E2F0C|nr:glycosyltransferase family 9 protein [Burkholderia sp. FERM BP-3421]WDD94425.1 ADP-heptose--LPS heptosyltransferase [Burkholderia sp. FERM BP-3421]